MLDVIVSHMLLYMCICDYIVPRGAAHALGVVRPRRRLRQPPALRAGRGAAPVRHK